MKKKVTVVLNAEGTAVDATKSVVTDAGFVDAVKQAVPFLRNEDTALVGMGTEENLVQTAVIAGSAIAGDHFGIKSKIGL